MKRRPDEIGRPQASSTEETNGLSRRDLLRSGVVGVVGLAAGGGALAAKSPSRTKSASDAETAHSNHVLGVGGEIDPSIFDPTAFLKEFDYGDVTTLPNGQVQREYSITAIDREIEVAPGVRRATRVISLGAQHNCQRIFRETVHPT